MNKDNHPLIASIALLMCLSLLSISNSQAKEPQTNVYLASSSFKPELESPSSAVGKKLAARQNCAACHSLEGHGGSMAPPFDGIGARRSRAFMLARITSGRAAVDEYAKLNSTGELFAHPRVPAEQAKNLVSYLLTLPEPAGGFKIGSHPVAEANSTASIKPEQISTAQSIKAGKSLFLRRNCLSCHSIGNGGGQFASRLDGISQRRDRAFIANTLTAAEVHTLSEEEKHGDKVIMSPSAFSPAQIRAVTDFLMSLPPAK